VRDEKRAKSQSIMIIEPDAQFREELYNFLLSAGYERTENADSFPVALNKIVRSTYAVVVADAGESWDAGLKFAADLARLSPRTKVILMIDPEDQPAWDQVTTPRVEINILIKTGFARDLLYLLEKYQPP
jgi:DNA-binding NtrC family response regulator